jgi:hypothetical protein
MHFATTPPRAGIPDGLLSLEPAGARTDFVVRDACGFWPPSVSTDRLGVTAMKRRTHLPKGGFQNLPSAC